MNYDLPESVTVNGTEYEINTDFRCILDIMEALSDADLSDNERAYFSLGFFYPDFSDMPMKDYQEAIKQLYWFINGGREQTQKKSKQLMSWEQDFDYIIGPVNRIIGHEIRADKNLHWWTFLSAYMEIGECLYSNIISIRQKLSEHKKLDKAEKEWYLKNRDIVDLKNKTTAFTESELEFLKTFSGGG